MSEPLHTKYRPQNWDEVFGQGNAVKALAKVIKRDESHAFMFVGPSGVGKTTLARIAAMELGAKPKDIMDIDAASNTGIDAMRAVQDVALYKPFGDSTVRCIIVDEAHRLSPQAWDSLLKAVEEPPKHVYWFFCTTQANKIPNTIKTRCIPVVLKELPDKELDHLLNFVLSEEDMTLPTDVGTLIINEAKGSARQLLVNLTMCRDVKNKKEAADILKTALDSDATLELCRFLISGGSWTKAMTIYEKLEEHSPEGVRIVVMNYMASVIKGAKSDKAACAVLPIMDAFAEPYTSYENAAPLLRSIARALFASQ